MQNRYLIQYWEHTLDRFVTDCSFQDGHEQKDKAVIYCKRMTPTRNDARGRILDQKHNQIIFETWRESDQLCWQHTVPPDYPAS